MRKHKKGCQSDFSSPPYFINGVTANPRLLFMSTYTTTYILHVYISVYTNYTLRTIPTYFYDNGSFTHWVFSVLSTDSKILVTLQVTLGGGEWADCITSRFPFKSLLCVPPGPFRVDLVRLEITFRIIVHFEFKKAKFDCGKIFSTLPKDKLYWVSIWNEYIVWKSIFRRVFVRNLVLKYPFYVEIIKVTFYI